MRIDRDHLRRALALANSYSRMGALLALQGEPDFWRLVGEEWSGCDNIAEHASRCDAF